MFKKVSLEPGIIEIHVAIWYVTMSLKQNQHSTYTVAHKIICVTLVSVSVYMNFRLHGSAEICLNIVFRLVTSSHSDASNGREMAFATQICSSGTFAKKHFDYNKIPLHNLM